MHTRCIYLGFALSAMMAFVSSAACTPVKSEALSKLEIWTTMGFKACRAEYHLACLKLRVKNIGTRSVSIGLDKPGQPLLHEAVVHLEGQQTDGKWRRVGGNPGSFTAPVAFVHIKPEQETEVLFDVGDDLRNFYPFSNYRVALLINSTEQVYSPALELGPRTCGGSSTVC